MTLRFRRNWQQCPGQCHDIRSDILLLTQPWHTSQHPDNCLVIWEHIDHKLGDCLQHKGTTPPVMDNLLSWRSHMIISNTPRLDLHILPDSKRFQTTWWEENIRRIFMSSRAHPLSNPLGWTHPHSVSISRLTRTEDHFTRCFNISWDFLHSITRSTIW